tara:strand:+ start:908 stop:1336 length:429 start_codon:yes stop_codon:yes gene_type:complete
MARRGSKRKRRRSPKTTSLLNVAEAYAQANVLTSGILGNSPVGVITGVTDLGYQKMAIDRGLGGGFSMEAVGGGSLSLGDIVSAPDQAFGIMQSNAMNNWQSMIVQSAGINIGFRLGKRLLRRPISSVNRTIFKQLGLGVRL